MSTEKVVTAFVPVLHEGYRKFFLKHKNVKTLYIFGKDLVEKEFPHLQKEIRALDPLVMKQAIESLGLPSKVEVLTLPVLKRLKEKNIEIISPDEDVSHELVEKYLKDKKVTFDNIFLRWDKHKSMEEKPVEVDQKVSVKKFDRNIIKNLHKEAEKSSDWWRRIASAIVKKGKVIFVAYNEHYPSQHSPYSDGDPRNNFHKGVGIEISTSMHSEASLIAQAAKAGESLNGASIFVTVFPCPPCAKLIAGSGIKKLYYSGGYALLDQDKLLKNSGVEIIYVN